MNMNVKPVPALDSEVNDIRLATAEIVNQHILPVEDKLWGWMTAGVRAPKEAVAQAKELRQGIQEKVKGAGLWAPHLPEEFGGMGLSFMQHAYMNEVLAYSPGAASLFGVVAPQLRQPEDPVEVRYAGAAREVAEALDGRPDAVRLLHDRTGQSGLRPAFLDHPRRAGWRRLGDQRPQMVHLQRSCGGLLHRHVPHGARG